MRSTFSIFCLGPGKWRTSLAGNGAAPRLALLCLVCALLIGCHGVPTGNIRKLPNGKLLLEEQPHLGPVPLPWTVWRQQLSRTQQAIDKAATMWRWIAGLCGAGAVLTLVFWYCSHIHEAGGAAMILAASAIIATVISFSLGPIGIAVLIAILSAALYIGIRLRPFTIFKQKAQPCPANPA